MFVDVRHRLVPDLTEHVPPAALRTVKAILSRKFAVVETKALLVGKTGDIDFLFLR